ncbi:oligomeric mucus gel-forming [Gnomoniopsis sp. IMI 355080]|nr:oligomeric mucus gel-forming [Gnomoniopsis sp. IMI 355080]
MIIRAAGQPLAFLWLTLCLTLAAFSSRAWADSIGISVTPHASYSSSIGVLGCKINTNRVAYWPMAVDCTNICVKLSYDSRSVHLLRIDQSGGAYDVSYDAWNYLQTGKSATKDPIAGGGVAMTYENASASACSDLIKTDGLALSASNSMDFLFSCLADDSSWVAQNYVLYNIADSLCSVGYNEKCTLDVASGANQATCAHTLGAQAELTSQPVYNIEYPTGQKVLATTGEAVSGATRAMIPAFLDGHKFVALTACIGLLIVF